MKESNEAGMAQSVFLALCKHQTTANLARLDFINFRRSCVDLAPVKIGDIVTITYYGYKGKKMRVYEVNLVPKNKSGDFEWVAYGDVLKDNGEPGKRRGQRSWKVVPV